MSALKLNLLNKLFLKIYYFKSKIVPDLFLKNSFYSDYFHKFNNHLIAENGFNFDKYFSLRKFDILNL